MKKIITYCIIIAVTLLSACRKSDNPQIPELTKVPVPLITKDASGDGTISKDDPAAFKGKFVVDNFFKEGVNPKKVDIVIIKNGDNSGVVHFKDGITTFPTTVDITGTQLITLFGPIVLGDKFTIGANITTQSGQTFEAFPNIKDSKGKYISLYGAGINGLPGASTQIDYIAVCPLVIDDFLGAATVVDDFFWEDTYPVTITLSSPGVLKVTGINQQANVSVLVYVDDKTYAASVPGEVIDANVSAYVGPYTNLKMDGKGTVDACNNIINLNITWTVDQGGFGTGPFIIKK
ncbi:MAG: hypothetical protein ABI237_08740 [Ginsengibacter sp.]